jgi:hypothetical protein
MDAIDPDMGTQTFFSVSPYHLVLFHGEGVMIDFLVNIGDPGAISAVFPWGVGSILAMGVVVLAVRRAAS